MLGYTGKIAYIDLSTKKVEIKPTTPKLAEKFIGGSGLAARLLYEHLKPEIDPLAPEAYVAVMAGPVTGTALPGSSRFAICGRSPLTGFWGEATSGGKFGAYLKKAGFDGLIITGKAPEMVYLVVQKGNVEIKPGNNLKGLDTYEVQEELKRIYGNNVSVACIGVAGENLMPMAAVINDHGRAAGRMGFGAVFGSKNLKAIVVDGQGEVPVADKESLKALAQELTSRYRKDAQLFTQYGTLGYLDIGYYFGDVPVKYFTKGLFPIDKINAKRFREEYAVHPKACWGCPIACGRELKFKGRTVDGPEYETAVSFGPLLQNFDLDTIVEANDLANRYGFDTISSGVTLALLMYLKEENLLPENLKAEVPEFGDALGILEALKLTGENWGIGRLIGQGVVKALEELGLSQECAAAVRKLEIPMHEPRAFTGQALSYATGPRGACHQRGDFFEVDLGIVKDEDLGIVPGPRNSIEGRVAVVAKFQSLRELDNCLVKCNFTFTPLKAVIGALSFITGVSWSPEKVLAAANNSLTIKRAISFNLGSSPADDKLPGHVKKPLTEGGAFGNVPEIEKYLPEFYKLRGWNSDGTIPQEFLARLLADD
ncbi:tungsten-containing aldehyde ferredoxin oxidoreductase [Carboxydothermus islandicus]|uniref:Tungsten-containing aldehyde ferredoxin oxidoreductase n=1 Tax=Carboxydothermus islandicus TaxID=661089 RepID=A0A1L8D041_9THEO|nr:aldehyde ferredoxin oxidoreductase family protein [Carboxydothermus islandicus]GAV24522.1 tungsten-containing aldehyde ferredoxin oxidoreductase [Carboxydothermus islandicus]